VVIRVQTMQKMFLRCLWVTTNYVTIAPKLSHHDPSFYCGTLLVCAVRVGMCNFYVIRGNVVYCIGLTIFLVF
jgi:hypothetical protein